MKKTRHMISGVVKDSIAWELQIEQGDELLEISGQPVKDVFDYHYLTNEECLELLIRKPDGEEWELEIEKEYEDDLGIIFENEFMDQYRSCSNRCVFCFIDQMPPGMRETLYFKDDDSRLSFLQGNYVTLTNMSGEDIDRVIRYHLSPINISFHTTNPGLRCQMLNNRFAGDIFEKVQRLYDAGITMNGQIVLCKGLNDGDELERSIRDLTRFLPLLESVSVVPVGLTKYRDGLYPLESFEKEDAAEVLRTVHAWQERLWTEHGTHFVHCSDEWYILAGEELPDAERYDGYLQLENGVGMLRLLKEEIEEALCVREKSGKKRKISIATGQLPYEFLKKYIIMIQDKYTGIQVQIYPVRNDFFGEKITVSGLLTGQDLMAQLAGKDLGEELLIPCNMLRAGEHVFLDNVTVPQLGEKLGVPVRIVEESGEAFVRAVLGEAPDGDMKGRQIYEQTDCSNCGQAECGEINPV
ncbi:DUF512 domain-containing protein [Ruminococcus sp. OA3]|uniref:DUF512 domain-containing protein n=1 Tax=Ruminococcus sp. OA3 TaxID=2914164 RepID=UPI001F065473|nr:DUF512 domain-containing protein [Ruminococcus sp. OA3]MCH1983675.1 DUF512 domain-containing protein [Ruminococcus sp. OA3]